MLKEENLEEKIGTCVTVSCVQHLNSKEPTKYTHIDKETREQTQHTIQSTRKASNMC